MGVKTGKTFDVRGLYSRTAREECRNYGASFLGRTRARIESEVTGGKPYDLAESKADSDKVLALLILELHDSELVSADLASVAASMLHGVSRAETLAKIGGRFAALDQIVTGVES